MGLLGTMSAVGTTLGPAVGGLLITYLGSRAIFLINVPLAAFAMLFTSRSLPQDPPRSVSVFSRLDIVGTAFLAVALTAYALAMTLGRGQFGLMNLAVLVTALTASIGFVIVEDRASAPIIRLELFRDRALLVGLSTNLIVSMVMMATLIVGPFYVTKALGLDAARAGIVLAVGPFVAALAGVPAGRLVDGIGTKQATCGGLAALATGAVMLSAVSPAFGVTGYLVPIVVITAGYGLFQAANNTAIMTGTSPAERGVMSGVLNLSRNLGLVTGASAMGTLFAWGAAVPDVMAAAPTAIVAGLHVTFAAAAALVALPLAIAFWMARTERAVRSWRSM